MTAKSNKEVAMVKKIGNVYLLSANLKASGSIVPGSARPIHDRFITVEDQAEVNQATSRQLYMTDSHGVICSFDTGKHLKTEDDALQQGFFLGSGVVLDNAKPKIYIPPMHLVSAHPETDNSLINKGN